MSNVAEDFTLVLENQCSVIPRTLARACLTDIKLGQMLCIEAVGYACIRGVGGRN